jgi:hypothetical protein
MIRVCVGCSASQHRQIDIWNFKNISDLVLTVFSGENTLPVLCYNFTTHQKAKDEKDNIWHKQL